MGWEVEGWQKCLPDNHHVQLFITGAEGGGERLTGGAGQRKKSKCVVEGEEEGLKLLFMSSCEQRAHLGPYVNPQQASTHWQGLMQDTTSPTDSRNLGRICPVTVWDFFHRYSSGGVLCWYVASRGPIRFYVRSVHTGYHHGSVNIIFWLKFLAGKGSFSKCRCRCDTVPLTYYKVPSRF